MAKRQKEWARQARFELRLKLGGACFECGSDKHLDFDCITPQGDEHHRMSVDQRVSFYRKQFALGNLQLLCRYKCHKKKNLADMKLRLAREENEPF